MGHNKIKNLDEEREELMQQYSETRGSEAEAQEKEQAALKAGNVLRNDAKENRWRSIGTLLQTKKGGATDCASLSGVNSLDDDCSLFSSSVLSAPIQSLSSSLSFRRKNKNIP